MKVWFILGLFGISFGFFTCDNPLSENKGIKIVCTTQMIADVVQNVTGETGVEVISLMGPGVDPHLYKATQGDVNILTEADIIFYNGLHLEGKMQDVFEKLARQKIVVPVSRNISVDHLIVTSDYNGIKTYDPHIWHSAILWSETIETIKTELIRKMPDKKTVLEENAMAYEKKLLKLNEDIKQWIARIPKEQRLLVTSHDAFNYYGREYGIEVKGLQGISTMSEIGIKDITTMVNVLTARNVKAVFVESSVPRRPLEAVIQGCGKKGHQVRIGGTLFSDAMGNAGTMEGTYIGMLKTNTQTILKALK